ncbi:hypothetical protein H5410_003711 [Solanum commersonii]|uniref:Uncharacterized protein n=1 Tax=Solanum commersonii TaxID=4109 RepID=A0A9J6B5V8_SOLCO|nr:hypothetical protein H5410_003711 [Solanum commersonii]
MGLTWNGLTLWISNWGVLYLLLTDYKVDGKNFIEIFYLSYECEFGEDANSERKKRMVEPSCGEKRKKFSPGTYEDPLAPEKEEWEKEIYILFVEMDMRILEVQVGFTNSSIYAE